MKASGQCPKCGERVLYVIQPVRHRVIGTHEAEPWPVITLNLAGHEESIRAGRHELWICGGCGFEEWYALDVVSMLETLVSVPESGVRRIGERRHGYR